MTVVTVIGKPGCHLCEVALGVVEHVVAELPDDAADRVDIVELSILDDASLHAQWSEKIPVILIDGELHTHWRVAPERLRKTLADAAAAAVAR